MASVDLTRIGSNIAAMNTLYQLRNVNSNLSLHQTRLASGKKINDASDDPAGLGLATKFRVRADSTQQAVDNIGDAQNMLSVAQGGLSKINDILGKMRVKSEQAASDTLGQTERDTIAGDLGEYAHEIDDIVNQTQWNGTKLLDGTANMDLQTSADSDKFTNWTLGQAHDVTGSGTAGLGDLAVVSGTSSATNTQGATSYLGATAVDAGNTVFGNIANELASGTYKVVLHVGTKDDGSLADSYAQLVDSNGEALTVDADGTGGGLVDNKLTFAYDNTGAGTVLDFGNGLQVTLANTMSTGTDYDDATVTYSKTGSYAVTLADAAAARTYMNTVDSAIATVSGSLAKVGALSDRMNFKSDALATSKINTESAYNRIMNADMAEEQLQATKWSILQQTSTTMLSQANSAPQSILSLFR
jgi:flagellin